MPWKAQDTMSLKQEFVALATKDGANRRELCRRSSAQPYGWGKKTGADADTGRPDARSASGRIQQTVMFARGRSTRGQMKSPSIALRGEGRG